MSEDEKRTDEEVEAHRHTRLSNEESEVEAHKHTRLANEEESDEDEVEAHKRLSPKKL